ncbi:hypothetical protein BOTBODRAFT_26371 [Botryobasidium botryosum FD-172 SS1]|uniref:Ankyrin repeat protein n=1 Tax=Botryobasidium botryosum (strain FD-172 SS1) TaxID=930990 RepID=A0A067MXQ6_BOTB1|nr:hypothetical protein BOTBODRAFT_26371 [Botryobasidium botryosum FD-172 SS1]
MAVGVRTSLKQPREWEQATRMDEAVLSGSLVRVRSADPTSLTQAGARVAIRFGYLDILEYLRDNARPAFERHYGVDGARIPNLASQLGRTSVLEWWLASGDFPKIYRADAMDDASTNGHVQVLEWWLQSRLPLKYTEASLEHASAKGHIAVLAWWKQSGLPLKIGRVMESAAKAPTFDALDWWARSQLDFKYDNAAVLHASCAGKVEVLRWWHESGLQMMYDREVLTGATRHNRPEVLEWWGKSGLPIQYRICDIEEALEDAVRPGSESKEWWARRGVNFNATNVEWMKWKNLN